MATVFILFRYSASEDLYIKAAKDHTESTFKSHLTD